MSDNVIIKADIQRRADEVREDIEAGRISLYALPPFNTWSEREVRVTTLNIALLLLSYEAMWN